MLSWFSILLLCFLVLSTSAINISTDLDLRSTCHDSLLPCSHHCLLLCVQVTDYLSRNGIPWEDVNEGRLTIKLMDVRNKELDLNDGE